MSICRQRTTSKDGNEGPKRRRHQYANSIYTVQRILIILRHTGCIPELNQVGTYSLNSRFPEEGNPCEVFAWSSVSVNVRRPTIRMILKSRSSDTTTLCIPQASLPSLSYLRLNHRLVIQPQQSSTSFPSAGNTSSRPCEEIYLEAREAISFSSFSQTPRCVCSGFGHGTRIRSAEPSGQNSRHEGGLACRAGVRSRCVQLQCRVDYAW